MMTSPTISVLIRTFNSGKLLPKVLKPMSLGTGDEILIVDSGSTDDTLSIAARYGARIIELPPPFNYSRSLNEGFRMARGDWVLVLSSHCIPLRNDLLSRMREIAAAAESDMAIIYGTASFFDPGILPPHVETGDRTNWQTLNTVRSGNRFAMYPRHLWAQQPFDESLRTAEDLAWLQWALESGYRVSGATDAVVLYRNQGSLCYMFRKGWHEALHAMAMTNGVAGGKNWFDALRAFAFNSAYLTKILLKGRCGPSAYLRMMAHGLGSAMASSAPEKRGLDDL